MTERECRVCSTTKPLTDFYPQRRVCKACTIARSKNRDPEYGLDARLWTKYRIRLPMYRMLISAQENRCSICKRDFDESGVKAVVDHDHSCCPTERCCGDCVRGIICQHCNTGLGAFRDDPDVLRSALNYLVYETYKVTIKD